LLELKKGKSIELIEEHNEDKSVNLVFVYGSADEKTFQERVHDENSTHNIPEETVQIKDANYSISLQCSPDEIIELEMTS